jgi:hypothetical protein
MLQSSGGCPLLVSSALTDAPDGVDVEPECLVALRGY